MPSAQIIDFGENPLAMAIQRGAAGVSGTIMDRIKQKKEEDAVQTLMSQYQPGANPQENFERIMSVRGLSPEKKSQFFSAMSSIEEQQKSKQAQQDFANKNRTTPTASIQDQIKELQLRNDLEAKNNELQRKRDEIASRENIQKMKNQNAVDLNDIQYGQKNALLDKTLASQKEIANMKIGSQNEARDQKNTKDSQAKEDKRIKDKAESKAILMKAGYSEEEAENASDMISPSSARTLLLQNKPVFESTFEKREADSISDYIDKVNTAGTNAVKDLTQLDFMDALVDDDATGFKWGNAIADWMNERKIPGAEGFRNPGTKAYTSAGKSFLRNIGDIVKGKVSNMEFETIRGMMSQAEDSPQTAKVINETQRMVRKIDMAEQKILNDILKESKTKPRDIQFQVSKRLQPLADAIARETTNNIRTILKSNMAVKDYKTQEARWKAAGGNK